MFLLNVCYCAICVLNIICTQSVSEHDTSCKIRWLREHLYQLPVDDAQVRRTVLSYHDSSGEQLNGTQA